MGFSSNTLIHLTDSLETLIQILLDRGFLIKYCHESISYVNDKLSYAVPMVSFSDIPLSQIKKQFNPKSKAGYYGNYGIGLDKKVTFNKRGINPVIYLEPYSVLSKNFTNIYHNFIEGKFSEDFTKHDYDLLNLFRFSKKYEGELYRKNKLVKEDYRFSDEREWRWVPSHTESFMKDLPPLMTESQYKNKKVLNEYNLKLFNGPRLQYELQSINYIIVKNDSKIPRIIEVLDGPEFRSKGVPNDSYCKFLHSRIITTDQILYDF